MRKVGEGGFNLLAPAKKMTANLRNEIHAKNIPMVCKVCGSKGWVNIKTKKHYCKNGYTCYGCFKKGQIEFKKAMINLARRKGLMK